MDNIFAIKNPDKNMIRRTQNDKNERNVPKSVKTFLPIYENKNEEDNKKIEDIKIWTLWDSYFRSTPIIEKKERFKDFAKHYDIE